MLNGNHVLPEFLMHIEIMPNNDNESTAKAFPNAHSSNGIVSDAVSVSTGGLEVAVDDRAVLEYPDIPFSVDLLSTSLQNMSAAMSPLRRKMSGTHATTCNSNLQHVADIAKHWLQELHRFMGEVNADSTTIEHHIHKEVVSTVSHNLNAGESDLTSDAVKNSK